MKGICYLSLFFLVACSTLKYKAIKTPDEVAQERRLAVEDYLKAEFQKKNTTYTSIDFDQTTVVKPESYYFLDSLFAIKYRLERKSKIDSQLEQKIANQQAVVSQDTTPIYYVEDHVFSLLENETYKGVHAKVSVSKKNEVLTMDILRTATLPKSLIHYFSNFCLNKSFFYSSGNLDESELAFYEFYLEKLNSLAGNEADQFLTTMLYVMKYASDSKNLDKSNLIQYMTLHYVVGNVYTTADMQFSSIDEFFDSKNQLLYYNVRFSYPDRDEKNKQFMKDVEVKLDPYLSLIEIVPINSN